jgi:excinuclease UvrABC nuclease subunit
VAEVVRRRYTRLLHEAKGEPVLPGSIPKQESDDEVEATAPVSEPPATPPIDIGLIKSLEPGSPIAKELQHLVDDVSTAFNRAAPPPPTADAAAADVHARRAAGSAANRRSTGLPDLILIDGGKGQLNAACAELEKLGLSRIPILGLAKEFEEIYRPGEKEPLRLSHDSGALKLLQRLRDECHRVANTYNAELRLRRISESLLDEFPNIGERRKAALLKKFGSVQRIRLASVEQIAEVSGFGGKAAGELKTFLEARSVLPAVANPPSENKLVSDAPAAEPSEPAADNSPRS